MTAHLLYPSKKASTGSTITQILNTLLFLYRFQRIGNYGYFQMLDEKLSYNDGQIACSKLFGHIVEFDERVPSYGKFKPYF